MENKTEIIDDKIIIYNEELREKVEEEIRKVSEFCIKRKKKIEKLLDNKYEFIFYMNMKEK